MISTIVIASIAITNNSILKNYYLYSNTINIITIYSYFYHYYYSCSVHHQEQQRFVALLDEKLWQPLEDYHKRSERELRVM